MKSTWPGNQVQHAPFPHCLSLPHQTTETWAGSLLLSLQNEWTTLSKTPSSSNVLLITLRWLAITTTSLLWQIRSSRIWPCFPQLLPLPHSYKRPKLLPPSEPQGLLFLHPRMQTSQVTTYLHPFHLFCLGFTVTSPESPSLICLDKLAQTPYSFSIILLYLLFSTHQALDRSKLSIFP